LRVSRKNLGETPLKAPKKTANSVRLSQLYRSLLPHQKVERVWLQLANPPKPRPGSARSMDPRSAALALATPSWNQPERIVDLYRICAVLNEPGIGQFVLDHKVPPHLPPCLWPPCARQPAHRRGDFQPGQEQLGLAGHAGP
jgi:hypothetical protein